MAVWRRPLFVMLLACIAVPVRAQSLSDSTYSFEPWPCPQSITPADLGYDGTIVYGGKRFAVSSLSLQVTTLDLTANPDMDFRLTPEQRRSVRDGFDVDALERLLTALPPGSRVEVFSFFVKRKHGEPSPLLTELGDPRLQALLDEVWAPRWLRLSDEEWRRAEQAVREGASEIPGRAAALRRREQAAVRPPGGS